MSFMTLLAKMTLDKKEFDEGLDGAQKQVNSFGQAWDKAKGQIGDGAKSVATGAGMLLGMGGAAYKAADSLSKNLDEIDKTSQKVGLSTKAYQEWDYVLKISGTDMESTVAGLKTLNNKFDDAVTGSDSAIETFERLGLSLEDIKGLSREDLLSAVITAFQGMEESAERAALANDLFGRSGQELAPLFNTTSEETQNLIKQVNDLGGIMSEDAVKEGAAFQDSLTSLKTAFAGASASLLTGLLPALTKIMDKISEFVSNGGLERVISTLRKLAPVIAGVITAVAGFKIVSGVISVVKGAVTVFKALNAVLLANPIGLVVAAVAALVAGFIYLWNHCEGFRQFWINLWEAIKAAFNAVVDWIDQAIKDIVEWFTNAWQDIKDAWSAVTEFFGTIWEGIKGVFSAVGNWFKERFETARDNVKTAWSKIGDWFGRRWTDIKTAFKNTGDWFKDKFTTAKDNVVNAWSNIKDKFDEIWQKIKDAFNLDDVWNWGRDLIDNFIGGLKEKWDNLKNSVASIGQTIKDFIGFSEPKKGPLSDFHKYAPDMMDLFIKGIKDNEGRLQETVESAFDFRPSITGDVGTMRGSGFSMGGMTVNVYGSDGMSVRELADEVERRIVSSMRTLSATYA